MINKTTLIKYKKYLSSLNLKKGTIKYYLWHTNKFLKWLGDKQLTKYALRKYHDELVINYTSVVSINLRLISINKYLKFIKNDFQFNLMTHKQPPIQVLTTKQLEEFLDLPLKNNQLINLRDKALLETIYATGLKVGQIIKLKKEQIDDITKEIIINTQHINIPAVAWSYLIKYLEARTDNSPWLFINLDRSNKKEDDSLSIRSVERIITKYGHRLTPQIKLTPQILRNTLAHELKLQGAHNQDIKKALHFKTRTGAQNYLQRL